MVFEGSSNLIESVESIEINGLYAESLVFYDGKALVIDQKSIALYKDTRAIQDELGNGLISMSAIPSPYMLDTTQTPWVSGHRSGFIGLTNECVLLILPNAIRLYESKQHALHNTNALSELSFD